MINKKKLEMIWQHLQKVITIAIFACIIFIFFGEQIEKQQVAVSLLNAMLAFFCLWYGRTRHAETISKLLYLGLAECLIIWKALAFSEISLLYFCINLLVLTVCYFICKFSSQNDSSTVNEETKQKIFPEHQADMERLEKLLESHNMLGVQAPYGEGKSFVVDQVCDIFRKNRNWNVIHIESLAYSYEDFDRVLVQKIFQILKENHIYSIYAAELLQNVKKSIWGKLSFSHFLQSPFEYSSTFVGLKEDLKQLENPLLIVFEDIERVGSPKYVKRLFAIAERLSSDKAKFVLEYDASILDEQGIDFKYREKYVPFEMNISEIPYRTLIYNLWDETEKPEYANQNKWGIEDYQRMPLPDNYGPLSFVLQQLHIQIEWEKIGEGNFSVRRVRNFLIESKLYLYKREYLDKPTKKIILKVFFLKFFVHDLYLKFKPGKMLEDLALFKNEYTDVNLLEFYSHVLKSDNPNSTFTKLMENRQNQESYYLFCFLGYNWYDYVQKFKKEKNDEKISESDYIQHLQYQEKREQKNRIIWNLLMNGESEYSNKQLFMKRFVNEVLDAQNGKSQQIAWERLLEEAFNETLYKDNNGIFYFGINNFVSLAENMFICGYKEKWGSFFQFYERTQKHIVIDLNFVRMLYFVDVQSEDNLLISAMDFFNKGELIGNLKEKEDYHKFLYKYIDSLNRWRFCESLAPLCVENWKVIGGFSLKNEQLLNTLKQLNKDVEKELHKKNNKKLTLQLQVIQKFISKNIKLMEMEKMYPANEHSVKMHARSMHAHQKEMDMIEEKIDKYPSEKNALVEAEELMNKLYEEGKLNSYELRCEQDSIKQKKKLIKEQE